jgi:hypothetical protein
VRCWRQRGTFGSRRQRRLQAGLVGCLIGLVRVVGDGDGGLGLKYRLGP